jgi:alkylation response protein AidB-like acyl-CoA dehydrogenase
VDLTATPQGEAFRSQIRAFLNEALPADWRGIGALAPEEATQFAAHWRSLLHEKNLLAPSWPTEYGGSGLTEYEQVVLAEEFTLAGVPMRDPSDAFGIQMLGNTLLLLGTEEQRRTLLPRILSGQDRWCQGYSEPGAGSDLAAVATRAQRDAAGGWIINGQKIWTSFADLANWIFDLARTENDKPRHAALSFLLVPIDQPGVEVRPIKNINGETDFSEVYFTDARCPADHIVGDVGGGWKVAMTLLGFERGELATTMPLTFQMEFDRLVELASRTGRLDDPVTVDRLLQAYVELSAMKALGVESMAAFIAGQPPGADAALFKLFWSEYHLRLTELAIDILGEESLALRGRPATGMTSFQCDDPGTPGGSRSWVETARTARAGTIYAGTSEIQRNIIGERLLGLPR